MQLYFLSLQDVLEIHIDQIHRYGGKGGVRDQNLLLSAIAQPCSQLHKAKRKRKKLLFFSN